MKWFYLAVAVSALLTAGRYGQHAARVPDGTPAGSARHASDVMMIESMIAFGLWEYTRRNPIRADING